MSALTRRCAVSLVNATYLITAVLRRLRRRLELSLSAHCRRWPLIFPSFTAIAVSNNISQDEITMFDRWVELPSDLLHEIVKHLHSPTDYVRFRAVCKSWNMDIPKTPNHIRGPWLVLPFNDETLDIEEKDFYLRLPEMQNTMLRGSYFGWLISVGIDGVLRMLNPFTKAHFDLPPMKTIPDIVDYLPDVEGEEYVIRTFRYDAHYSTYVGDKVHVQKIHVQKIIISSSPDNDKQDDFMAITIYGEYNRLAFCKFADTKWTEFSTPGIINCCLEDAIFFEGKVYAINWNAKLFEFDVKTSMGGISEVPKPDGLELYANMSILYLIRSVEGSLLLVVRHLKNVDTCYKTDTFDIFKLDQSAKQWTRMLSLGNYVLVVGFNSSVCVLPFSDGKGNWVRNCIYFSDNNVEGHYPQIVGGHDAGVFNLEDGRVRELFPNSEFLCPPPIWLFS